MNFDRSNEAQRWCRSVFFCTGMALVVCAAAVAASLAAALAAAVAAALASTRSSRNKVGFKGYDEGQGERSSGDD